MRRRPLQARTAHLPPEALRDGELAAIALGLPLAQAEDWLANRGHRPGTRTDAALERRCDAYQTLNVRLAARPLAVPVIGSVEAAVAVLAPRLASLSIEELHVLGLDSRNRMLGAERIARGAVNQVLVTAREVFRPLVMIGAVRAIVAHNHPSGDPRPSEADEELTARLCVAGDLLGIRLVDHIVIAPSGHHSFARTGELIRRKSFRPRRRGNVGQGIGIG
jgi:DNA repair protein RadC